LIKRTALAVVQSVRAAAAAQWADVAFIYWQILDYRLDGSVIR